MKQHGKKSIKEFDRVEIGNESGSVTVFFIIIFLCIIMLTGSMIDISRIMVADNKMDSAMRASTKSMMAEYDEKLIGAYGIFANDLETNNKTFAEYLEKNLELSSNAFLDYELLPDTVKVTGNDSTTLANDEVLQSQINSYMEIKAPINSGLRLVTRATEVIKSVIESDFSKKLYVDKKEIDKTLDTVNVILLKNSENEVSNTSIKDLEDARADLKAEREALDDTAAQTAKDLKDSTLAEADPGKSISVSDTELIGVAIDETNKMITISKEILSLQKAIADEEDQSVIDSLERQLDEKKEAYREAQKRLQKL